MLSTPRQQPQRQVSTPSAPAAAHRLRAHRTIFSAALGSAQKKSGAAEQQRAATYSAALGRLIQQMDELQARIDRWVEIHRGRWMGCEGPSITASGERDLSLSAGVVAEHVRGARPLP